MIAGKPVLFTIGHSNHSFERFAELLARHAIERIVDVRSFPRSRLPWFSRGEIEGRLGGVGIGYEFLGRELGGRDWVKSDGSSMELEEIITAERFLAGLARLQTMMQDGSTCVMCAEAEAIDCHRTRFIAPCLSATTTILHISSNGGLKTQRAAEVQLVLPSLNQNASISLSPSARSRQPMPPPEQCTDLLLEARMP